MSKPKKPGTDLAALKARLAKKTAGTDDIPPPGHVAAPEVPPPGHVAAPEVPPPGQVAVPAYDVPPPGYVPEPAMPEVPPPGQVAMHDIPPPGMQVPPPGMQMPPPGMQAPPPGMQAQMPMQPTDYGGGFDPDAGLIDSGPEIKPRGSKGLVVFAALGAFVLGGLFGWIGHNNIGKRERIEQGKAKGEKMVAQVVAVSDARKTVSLAMEDLKKDVAQDPAAAAEKVTTLLTSAFDKQPQISEMFGWQLASVDPAGVKATFQLFAQVTELQKNLSLMAKVLGGYGAVMKVGGPALYGVTMTSGGARLVAIVDSLCGEVPPEGEPPPEGGGLKSCGGDSSKAVAYKIIDMGGGDATVAPRGVAENQVTVLLADGKAYEYAIGIEQGNNAANFYKMALGQVEASLEEMNAAEEKALASLKRYAEDPNVDGSAEGGEG
ncbi:hypothetical protein [Paraliomyxa miuraensis]|uniref:hypothetical protein n=1 Tax=Paraliomyxa miuraensis TaxID=376150 RepID=UPI00225645F3|nr:hypothetical protein [Paraliomyxa miuraensis]MCX4245647.1 hypothetical protein [Paraliomyxa miuraensis]